jgi:hypothetical protein
MGRRSVAGLYESVRSMVSLVVRRLRSRAAVELENFAVRHQLHVPRRQRPGRRRLFTIDRCFGVGSTPSVRHWKPETMVRI